MSYVYDYDCTYYQLQSVSETANEQILLAITVEVVTLKISIIIAPVW